MGARYANFSLNRQTEVSWERNKKGKKQDSKQFQKTNTGENPTRSTW